MMSFTLTDSSKTVVSAFWTKLKKFIKLRVIGVLWLTKNKKMLTSLLVKWRSRMPLAPLITCLAIIAIGLVVIGYNPMSRVHYQLAVPTLFALPVFFLLFAAAATILPFAVDNYFGIELNTTELIPMFCHKFSYFAYGALIVWVQMTIRKSRNPSDWGVFLLL